MGLPRPCKEDTFGVGYTPTPEEPAKVKSQVQDRRQARKQGLAMEMQSYPSTLNGQLIKKGEGFPCYEFPEPLIKDGKRHPGVEIF